jgi:hypothetical protein
MDLPSEMHDRQGNRISRLACERREASTAAVSIARAKPKRNPQENKETRKRPLNIILGYV